MPNISQIKSYLLILQNNICNVLETQEPTTRFHEDPWTQPIGEGRTRVIANGDIFEKGGVNFSHVKGESLPSAATARHPELASCPFEALGISLVIHPKNPFVPTSHMNVRYFQSTAKNGETVWWFGGGYDLTPYYGFEEDCVHWHQIAKKACDAIHPGFYADFKKNADDYFYLAHRNECRGIGGLFFDDLNSLPFEDCFQLMQTVGNSYVDAYLPIVEKRKNHAFDQKNRDFQCYRRGRYVEFNLIYDRGTLFGLRFGGRIESILMSLPPVVHWQYDFNPQKNSPEERLVNYFLVPREWV